MNLKELDSFKLSDAISFHDELNPNLWDGQNLQPDVKKQLIIIAKDFLEELGVNDLDVVDITVSGSNAAYSYTPHSDLDLHILVDLSELDNNEIYKELFNAKKTIYNDTHNITIHGVPVELYVQDSREPVVSLGEYSILKDKWLRIPTKRRANLDQTATKQKYIKLKDIVNRVLKSKNILQVNKVIQKIKQYRKAGLDKGGEFGPENLAYKILRKQGLIQKLYDLRDKLHSEQLTIEDYDPNGPPPGPEFKPTMPKGTVRVDVSDVYDWYKLGQHISNMKGLGKHDFGKGPPSTILSFGDEDLEHQYIKALQKTGLSTTDIDPVDPKQPKGMKRQKVDPTYNVNEELNQDVEEVVNIDTASTGFRDEKDFGDYYIKAEGSDVTYSPGRGRNVLHVRVFDKKTNKEVAWADFIVQSRLEDGEKYLESMYTRVKEEYRGKGLAKLMYHYANSLGNDVQPSTIQTPMGKDMWKGLTKSVKQLPKLPEPTPKPSWWQRMFTKKPATVSNKAMAESFDQPYKLKWEKGEHGDVDALVKLPDGTPLSIMFNNEGMDTWQVEFYRSNTQEITKEGDAQKIFATVLSAIQKFVKKYKPSVIRFSASKQVEPGQSSESRAKLYDRLVKRYANSWGYDANSQNIANEIVLYQLTRRNQKNMSEASGYIPSEKEKNDPRFKTALTVDVRPNTMKNDAKKFGNKISRAGIPPTLQPSGKF